MPEYTHLNDIKVQGSVKSSAQGMLIGGVTDFPPAGPATDCIVLYAGATTATHTKGKFYKSNGASWNLYEGNIVLDSTPTQNSTAPITSGAVYTGLAGKADAGSTDSALNNKVDKTTYNAKIEALEGADSDMQGTLDGHGDSISTLQGEMADAKASISTLQSEKAAASDVDTLRTSLSTLETTVGTLSTSLEATFKVELVEAKADGTPNVADPQAKTIYLVPINDGVTNDVKAEYIYVSDAWEKIGTTAIGITVDATLSSTSTNPLQNQAIHSALAGKVDKATGMGLSTNDYSTAEKNKLQGIASGAQVNVIESINVNGTAQSVSDSKAVDIKIPTAVSGFTNDAGYLTSTGTIDKAVGDANGATIHTTYAKAEDVAADLAGKQATIKGAATTIADANLTASRALVSDTNGKVAVSAVTSTELSYLDGVTSNIQDQLSGKLATTGTAAKATADANGSTIHTTYATTTALANKMDKMTVDATPTEGSNNLVKSGGVFSAINTVSESVSSLSSSLSNKMDKMTVDTTPTSGSSNLVTSGGVYTAINNIDVGLPSAGSSTTPIYINSSGVPTACSYSLGAAASKSVTTSVTSGSSALVTSGAVYTAINNASSRPYTSKTQVTDYDALVKFINAAKVGDFIIAKHIGNTTTNNTGRHCIYNLDVTCIFTSTSKYDPVVFAGTGLISGAGNLNTEDTALSILSSGLVTGLKGIRYADSYTQNDAYVTYLADDGFKTYYLYNNNQSSGDELFVDVWCYTV